MKALIDGKKCCRLCKEYKELQHFHPNKTCSYGVVGTCKVCAKIRVRKWYSDNRKRRQYLANKRNQDRKKELILRFGGICFDCKNIYPQCVYQFHHLDPSQKDFNPSAALTMRKDRMEKELAKCVMLCANCHLIRHYGRTEEENARTN